MQRRGLPIRAPFRPLRGAPAAARGFRRARIAPMFDIGGPEFVFLALLALLVFGPRRLPELGRTAGEHVARLRRAWLELRRDLEREVSDSGVDELRRGLRDAGRELDDVRDLIRPADGTAARGPDPGSDGPGGAVP